MTRSDARDAPPKRFRILTRKSTLAILLLLASVLLAANLISDWGTRPAPPPPGVEVGLPFGAIDLDELHMEAESQLQSSIEEALRNPSGWNAGAEPGEVRPFEVLALTGGGSRGAFGAGILCGWTAAGSRPDFKIVTGVSTGALQSTFAFLGSEYDSVLEKIYTEYETSDLYEPRSGLEVIFSDSANDSAGLRRVIHRYVTPELLESVADKHRRGYRLFVGTTNLDTTEFIIWDMGKIAASGRPDAREHYCDVLLASASIPVFFPPVYFAVDAGGKTYHEMHVDGSTYSNLAFRGFMLDIEDAMDEAGLTTKNFDLRLFIVRNGRRDEEAGRHPVAGSVLSIAEISIRTLFKLASTSAMYRAYVLAQRNDIDYHLAVIPTEYEFDFEVTEFDKAGMRKLFDFGYEQTADNGYEWLDHPPFIDPDELFR